MIEVWAMKAAFEIAAFVIGAGIAWLFSRPHWSRPLPRPPQFFDENDKLFLTLQPALLGGGRLVKTAHLDRVALNHLVPATLIARNGTPPKELKTVRGVNELDRAEPPAPQPQARPSKAPTIRGFFFWTDHLRLTASCHTPEEMIA